MTDNERKEHIRKLRAEVAALRYDKVTLAAETRLLAETVRQLRAENEQLRQRVAVLDSAHRARISDLECEAYNI